MPIPYQRHKDSHLGERGNAVVRVGAQQGDHGAARRDQAGQEVTAHALTVNHYMTDAPIPGRRRVAGQDLRQANRQMRVAAMRGGQQRMSKGIVEQDECPTAFDRARAPDQPVRNAVIRVDRRAVTITVMVGGCGRFCGGGVPELRGPAGQRIGEVGSGTGVGESRQESLDIGPAASGEQSEGITAVATEIPGAAQSDDREKEQGQQQRAQGGLPHPPEMGGRRGGGNRGLHRGDQARLVGDGPHQQAARAVLPDRLRFHAGIYRFFSGAGECSPRRGRRAPD